MSFEGHQNTILEEVVFRNGVKPDPNELHALIEMPPPTDKKEFKSFSGIMNYLGKLSLTPAEVVSHLEY